MAEQLRARFNLKGNTSDGGERELRARLHDIMQYPYLQNKETDQELRINKNLWFPYTPPRKAEGWRLTVILFLFAWREILENPHRLLRIWRVWKFRLRRP